MWTLTKEFEFQAAHKLPMHDGKCKRVHGHLWRGAVVVEGRQLHSAGPKVGMLIDFADLKAVVTEMVDKHLDHYFLNETLPLEATTSEMIARWCFNHLKPKIPGLVAIVIEESPTSRCEYRE